MAELTARQARAAAVADDVARYEARFARAAGATHALAFAYARTALASILHAAGLQPGDEVVLSPLTCRVVPLAILSAGLRPLYADISAHTLNLDAACARNVIGERTRAVLFQHTYGWSAGVEEMAALARAKGLLLVEDCAQCLPGAGSDAPGTYGDAAIFSNNSGKPLPAGSGGIAILRDQGLATRVRADRDALRQRTEAASLVLRVENAARNRLPPMLYWSAYLMHRRLRDGEAGETLSVELKREIEDVALRINDRDAREGLRWLDRLEQVRRHRTMRCAEYADALGRISHVELVPDAGGALYYFPALVQDKPELLERARQERVQLIAWPITTPIYPVEDDAALHRYGYERHSCPVAEQTAQRLVGLPTDLTIDARHRAAVVALLAQR